MSSVNEDSEKNQIAWVACSALGMGNHICEFQFACWFYFLHRLWFLLQAALPSLTNPPSLSPIRRKGKEKEPGEQASAPLSPKKGSEASPGMKC